MAVDAARASAAAARVAAGRSRGMAVTAARVSAAAARRSRSRPREWRWTRRELRPRRREWRWRRPARLDDPLVLAAASAFRRILRGGAVVTASGASGGRRRSARADAPRRDRPPGSSRASGGSARGSRRGSRVRVSASARRPWRSACSASPLSPPSRSAWALTSRPAPSFARRSCDSRCRWLGSPRPSLIWAAFRSPAPSPRRTPGTPATSWSPGWPAAAPGGAPRARRTHDGRRAREHATRCDSGLDLEGRPSRRRAGAPVRGLHLERAARRDLSRRHRGTRHARRSTHSS